MIFTAYPLKPIMNNRRQNISKLLRKKENSDHDFIQKISSLPTKAFIKCEYVKCGKANCDQEHGPYYNGYWKDDKTKKTKKKVYW